MSLGMVAQNKAGIVFKSADGYFYSTSPLGDRVIIDEVNDLFVAPGGTDTIGRIGIGQPYATIRFAQENNPSAKRLVFRAGTYTESWDPGSGNNAMHLLWSGTDENNRAEYVAYPGETVIIDQQGAGFTSGLWALNKLWLRIHGLTIRNCRGNGGIVLENGCHDALITNNTIHAINGNPSGNVGGIYPTTIPTGNTQRMVARNNDIYDIRVNGSISSNASCIHTYGLNNSTISNNNLSDANNAVMFKSSTGEAEGNVVTLNRMFDQVYGVRFSVAGGGDPIHQNQVILQNIMRSITQNAVYSELQDTVAINQTLLVKNNVFDDCRVGSYVRNWNDAKLINNLYLNNSLTVSYLSNIDHFSNVTNFISDYNHYFDKEVFRYDRDPPTTYNSLSSWELGTGQDASSQTGNPLIEDQANQDYRPQVGSPLLGAGENGENIGAFLTGKERIGANL